MASGNKPQATMAVGLRNSVRFVWKEKAIGGREWFIKTLLIEGLKTDPGQVFCLQWNAPENGYDLTLHSQVSCDRLLATCKAKAEEVPVSLFRVEPLCQRGVRVVTVHMYNPHVGDAAVALFLGRYGKVDKPVKYLRDSYGIWSGRRQFRVLLRDDPDSSDGLQHPPAYFSLGGDRGFLFYSGQPSFCRQCRSFGHMAAGCTQFCCRNCGGAGHAAASCAAPRVCHGCGATGHLFRDCPSRARTYADVAGETHAPILGPLEKVLQENRGVEGAPPVRVMGPAAEAFLAVEAIPADGGEAVAEVLPVSGGSLFDTEVLVSLGDSLTLEGSWADCEMNSESGDLAEAVSGGVRRRRASSGGEPPEASQSEPMVQVPRRRKKRKGIQAGSQAEAVAERAPLKLSGHYDALAGDSGEDESSGWSAVKEGGTGFPTSGRGTGPEAEDAEAGPVIISADKDIKDSSGVASQPVDLGPVSPLSPVHSFLETASSIRTGYLQDLESSDPESSSGTETEGTVGETGRV